MKVSLSLGVLIVLMISTSIMYFLFAIYGESMEYSNILSGEIRNESTLSNHNEPHSESQVMVAENITNTGGRGEVLHEEGAEELREENHVQSSTENFTGETGPEENTESSVELHVFATTESLEAGEVHNEAGEVHNEAGEVHNEAGEVHNEAGEVHNEAGEVHNEAEESAKKQIETPILSIIGIAYLIFAIMLIIYRPTSRLPFIVIIIGSTLLIGLYIISRSIGFAQVGIERVGPFDLITNLFQVGIIVSSLYLIRGKAI